MRSSLPAIPSSLRSVTRHKRFSLLAVLSLGLAVALNTTMYSVLDALVNPTLDMRDHQQLYRISFYGDMRRLIPQHEKDEALALLPIVEGLATHFTIWGAGTLAERGPVVGEIRVANVSPNFFTVVGVQPMRGRLLSDVDLDREPKPVVLSEVTWRRFFPDRGWFDGATLSIEGTQRPVIGVLAYTADFPGTFTDVWQVPSSAQLRNVEKSILRVRVGVSREQAADALQSVAYRLGARVGEGPRDVAYRIKPAIGDPFTYQRFHLALISAVVAVLLVACVNLANLQLARGLTRSRELATRAAVGATRSQIIRGLLLESGWLALGGMVLGILLTLWGVRIIAASVPQSLSEYVVRPQVSWRLFAFASAATLAALGLIGLAPAVRLSRVDINDVLKSGAGTGSTRQARRQYGALVVVQVALALALTIAATLLTRTASTFLRVTVDPAFSKLLFASPYVRSLTSADSAERQTDVSRRIVREVRAVPTVADAAVMRMGSPERRAITITDADGAPKEVAAPLWGFGYTSPSIIRALGARILKGRDFTEEEFAEPLAIIDEATAVYLWPGGNPVGQQIKLGAAATDAQWVRVVGVARTPPEWYGVRTTHEVERLRPRLGAVYVLESGNPERVGRGIGFQLIVRGTTRLHQLPVLLRRAFAPLAPRITVFRMRTFEERTGLAYRRERHGFVAALFSVFALLALATAALGVYAVVSHSVRTRTREFAVRIALGATARDIRQTVFFEGNVLALLGIAAGLIITARTSKWLVSFLMGEEEIYDAWLFALVALCLFGITLLASWLPARRAMGVNAVEALRND